MKLFCFSSASGESFRISAESEGEASKALLTSMGIRLMGELEVVDTVRVPLTNNRYVCANTLVGRVVRVGFGNL